MSANDNDITDRLPIRTMESYEVPSIASGTDALADVSVPVKDVAKGFTRGWHQAAKNGAHVSPELRKALEDAGVPADQVVARVDEMVARAGYKGPDKPVIEKRVFRPSLVPNN